MRAVLLAVFLLVALPGAASASVLPTGGMTHDDQWSRFTVPMNCDEAQPGRTDCLVEITTSYQFNSGYPKFNRLGDPVVADTRQITIPVGSPQKVVIETSNVLKGIAKKGGSFYTYIAVELVGMPGYGFEERSYGSYSEVGDCGSRSPLILPWSGRGKLFFKAGKDDTFDRVSGPVTRNTFMAGGTNYQVKSGPVTYEFKGVRYTFKPGSEFIITCSGVGSVGRGASVLTPSLTSGSVSVKTSAPEMKQPAAYVLTSEGNLGTRAKETTRFTVTRNEARRVSTLAVAKGKQASITPWNTTTRSPCTAGQKLKVNRRGVISRA